MAYEFKDKQERVNYIRNYFKIHPTGRRALRENIVPRSRQYEEVSDEAIGTQEPRIAKSADLEDLSDHPEKVTGELQ
jgi:hypothetical protein